MADLSDKNSSAASRIVGADSSGVETNFVDSTAAGAIHSNLRDSSGTEIGTSSNPIRNRSLDNLGATTVYSGTATTTAASVPSVANKVISGIGLDNTGNSDIQISFDGGTSFKTVGRGEFLAWDVKGEITQVRLKTPTSTTTYEIIINFEP